MDNLYPTTKYEMLIPQRISLFLSPLLFVYRSKFLSNNAAAETFFKNLTLTNEQLHELYSYITSVASATRD